MAVNTCLRPIPPTLFCAQNPVKPHTTTQTSSPRGPHGDTEHGGYRPRRGPWAHGRPPGTTPGLGPPEGASLGHPRALLRERLVRPRARDAPRGSALPASPGPRACAEHPAWLRVARGPHRPSLLLRGRPRSARCPRGAWVPPRGSLLLGNLQRGDLGSGSASPGRLPPSQLISGPPALPFLQVGPRHPRHPFALPPPPPPNTVSGSSGNTLVWQVALSSEKVGV